MSVCAHAKKCSLSDCISMGAALRVWQSFYCEGVFDRCERFKLLERGHGVPDRLLPNGKILEPGPRERVRTPAGG